MPEPIRQRPSAAATLLFLALLPGAVRSAGVTITAMSSGTEKKNFNVCAVRV